MKVELLRRAPKRISRRFTVSLDQGASRAHFQRLPHRKQQHLIETLTVVTRGRVGARQVPVSSWSSRPAKNKRTLSFNFKCHPQAPTFLAFRQVCPLTISRSGCELQAPEVILGLLHRGAKGVAVVTRLFRPTSSRVRMVLEAMREVVQAVVQRTTLPTACCRTPFEGVSCVRFDWPAPDAAPCSSSSFEQAHCATHVVLALMGSPCEVARTPCTALDFRSGAGPMQVMTLRIED